MTSASHVPHNQGTTMGNQLQLRSVDITRLKDFQIQAAKVETLVRFLPRNPRETEGALLNISRA